MQDKFIEMPYLDVKHFRFSGQGSAYIGIIPVN